MLTMSIAADNLSKPLPFHAKIPDTLVHYVAHELWARSDIITTPVTLVRELSPAPLPLEVYRQSYAGDVEQWHMGGGLHPQDEVDGVSKAVGMGWFGQIRSRWRNQSSDEARLKPLVKSWLSDEPILPAQRVLAPFLVDGWDASQMLEQLARLPAWFAQDGVLLFAMLGAGAVPELINRDSSWLAHVQHLPSIMDTGARLQALRFGLPVLDVETVQLGYSEPETMWQDLYGLSPTLHQLTLEEQAQWRTRLVQAFSEGVQILSFEVIFGQVWQPVLHKQDSGVRTVSLESLTRSLLK